MATETARANSFGSQLSLDDLFNAAGRNPIYRFIWGCWSRDQFTTLKTVESMWGAKLFGGRVGETIDDFLTMRAGAFAYVLNSRCVFACALPAVAHVDTSTHFHNFDGPAIEFPDGYGVHIWRGVAVDAKLVEECANLTALRIELESNVEIRRLLIERYGTAKYLTDSQAEVIQQDKYGELLFKRQRNDEPIVMVRVTNSTAEPDGTFKSYYLRVPPDTTTAREAVAWTFEMSRKDYSPDQQT